MNSWSVVFVDAVRALLDALSYVSDFDVQAFVSSLFSSADSPAKTPDETADQAILYLNRSISLVNTLKAYKPVENGTEPSTWWVSDEAFNVAKELVTQLKTELSVLDDFQLSINSLQARHNKFARKRMLFFKKLCETAINEIDSSIIEYNRFVAVRHSNYKLDRLLDK